MDKFTKTTEVDIPNTATVEDEAPQKSKTGKIIAAVACVLLAIVAWIYVVETDDTKVEKVFDGVEVVVLDSSDDYVIKTDKVSVTLVGTNSQLVDVDASKIIVKVNALKKQNDGKTRYCVYSSSISYEGEEEIEIKEKSVKVWVSLEEKTGK